MTPAKMKKAVYALLFLSVLYGVPALLLYGLTLKQILFPADVHTTVRQSFAMILDQTGEGLPGLLLLVFLGAWVFMIYLGSRVKTVPKTEASGKKQSCNRLQDKLLTVSGWFVKANIILAFCWFGCVDSQIGGHLHCHGADCYITKRGDFVRSVTAQQAQAYKLKQEAAITYLVSSLVLMLTGFFFLSCLGFASELNSSDEIESCRRGAPEKICPSCGLSDKDGIDGNRF